MPRDPNCTKCKLHQTAEWKCLWGVGPKQTDVMIIGEGPGHREDDEGRAFVGRAGKLLDQVLHHARLDREDIYITNATKCKPGDRKPGQREVDSCKPYLIEELKSVKPKYVALLGNVAVQSALGITGIKKLRGRPVERDGIVFFPMYHPSFVLRGDNKDLPILEQDMETFAEIVSHGGVIKEEELNSKIVESDDDVEELLTALTGVVSFDLETTCLYPWAPGAAVVTIGFGTASGEYSLFLHHRSVAFEPDELTDILRRIHKKIAEDCVIVAQGGKFDALWMLIHYDLLFHIDFDTLMASYLLDENSPHDLTYLARLYFGAHDWDIPLEQKQGNAFAEIIAHYHAHDLFYTRKLYFKMKSQLQEEPMLWRLFLNLTMPCVNLFTKMEAQGAYIDIARMDTAEEYLNTQIAQAERELTKWGTISWTSPKQVAELLFGKLKIKPPVKTKKGAPSTAESALNQIDHPCVDALKRLRAANQEKSFFIKGWRPYIVEYRLHPHFKLHGTVTGRPSAEHPNFQQTTREKRIRSLVIAPPGFELVEADLSQIELRIIAELSRDPEMMQAFHNGVDIHWLTGLREIERGGAFKDLVLRSAHSVTGDRLGYGDSIQALLKAGVDACEEIDPMWKELRKKAKAVNFGYSFGMWWKKFRQYARDNYGVHLTDREAQDSRKAFFGMYRLEAWHDKQRNYARTHGYVNTLSGQKRRLPAAMSREDTPERGEALRQAINAPVQGFAAHINLMVLLQMTEEFSWGVFRPFATVHDSILSAVRLDFVERVAQRFEEIMKSPDLFDVFDIKLSVPICGEIKIGPWGSGVSLEKWTRSHHDILREPVKGERLEAMQASVSPQERRAS